MKIIKVDLKNLKNIIREAKTLIERGKVIAYPTDTIYGLIADATSKKAVERIFQIKKRPKNKPLPIFVKDLKMARKLAYINKEQEKFLRKVWPGKVTAVLKRKKTKTKLYGVDKKTIALRIPNYRLVKFLLKELNKPLVGTSANISGKPASGNIKEVVKQFTLRRGSGQEDKKYQPDLVIDAGLLPGKPSKVIDLTALPPKILRE